LSVPPGFSITTEVCSYFYSHDKTYPKELRGEVETALAAVGRIAGGKTFGDGSNPLLVSVRSGARASMRGMMDTVLNLGLNDITVEALITGIHSPSSVAPARARMARSSAATSRRLATASAV
jgi:pyruvate,orthophosphate dikinase